MYAEFIPLNIAYKEAISQASEAELEIIYKDLHKKCFLDYRVDLEAMLKDMDFKAPDLESKKKVLFKIIDSNMDYVPLEE